MKYLFLAASLSLACIASVGLVQAATGPAAPGASSGAPASGSGGGGAQPLPADTAVPEVQIPALPALQPATDDLRLTFTRIIERFLGILGIIVFGYVLYAGVMYLTAGSGDGAENAKKVLTNAIVGLIIVFLSYSITAFLVNQLNSTNQASQSSQTSTKKSP